MQAAHKSKKTLKFQMMMSPEEASALDDWMHRNRLKSRAEAIRCLCQMGMNDDVPRFVVDVLAERRRQVERKGWTPEHDDGHTLGELGLAAALYALPYEAKIAGETLLDQDSFIGLAIALEVAAEFHLKPEEDVRRRKVKAAALLLAEGERIDRAARKAEGVQ